MATATSLSLLKGGKKAVDDELEKPAPATEQVHSPETEEDEPIEEEITVDVDKMDSKSIDALVAENEIAVPDNWKKMKVGEKRAWLKEQFEEAPEDAEAEDDVGEPINGNEPEPEKGIEVGADLSEEESDPGKALVEAAVAEKKTAKKGKVLEKVASGDVQSPGDDVLADLVFQIENMKEKEARALVGTLNEETEVTFFRLGGVLSVIQANGWFTPYASFKEFVENEHGLHYRKATYWVGIYNSLAEAKVPWSKVSSVGWTKLKEIASVLTNENVDEWVGIAKSNNTIALIEIVKNHKLGGGSKMVADQSSSTVTTKTFKVHDEQKANIEAALEKAKQESGTTVDTVALELICLDYLGGETLATKLKNMGIEAALAAVEKAFPSANITVDVSGDE